MRAIAVGLLVLVGLAGCSSSMAELGEQGLAPEVSRAPEEAPEGALLGTIRLQERNVQVHASPRGPRYTVMTVAGEVLARGLSEVEIQAALPSIYELLKTSAAEMEGGTLDARIDSDVVPMGFDEPGVFGPAR